MERGGCFDMDRQSGVESTGEERVEKSVLLKRLFVGKRQYRKVIATLGFLRRKTAGALGR